MQPPLFFAPPEARTGDDIVLPPSEARHAVKVMRLRAGAIVVVIDGFGNAFRAEVAKASTAKVLVRVHSQLRDYGEPTVHLTLASGLSVGLKYDSVVKRGTELGVKRFVPLLTQKSVVTLEDPRRARARVTRLERVALSAVKQCRRSCLPQIALPIGYNEFLKDHDPDDLGLIFHGGRKVSSLDDVPLGLQTKRVTLVVGPESGFTDDEIDRATAAGFMPVGLGSRILRSETAAPVAAALVMDRLGELR